jgi:hypothetical protein
MYMHISKMQIAELTSGPAHEVVSIDTDNVRLLDSDHAEYKCFVGLDLQAGLTICELPIEDQDAFWKSLEPQIDSYCKMFVNSDLVKAELVLVLPDTLISHTEDTSDEILAYLCRKPEVGTVVGFTSLFNFGGPCGPDLMLAP